MAIKGYRLTKTVAECRGLRCAHDAETRVRTMSVSLPLSLAAAGIAELLG